MKKDINETIKQQIKETDLVSHNTEIPNPEPNPEPNPKPNPEPIPKPNPEPIPDKYNELEDVKAVIRGPWRPTPKSQIPYLYTPKTGKRAYPFRTVLDKRPEEEPDYKPYPEYKSKEILPTPEMIQSNLKLVIAQRQSQGLKNVEQDFASMTPEAISSLQSLALKAGYNKQAAYRIAKGKPIYILRQLQWAVIQEELQIGRHNPSYLKKQFIPSILRILKIEKKMFYVKICIR